MRRNGMVMIAVVSFLWAMPSWGETADAGDPAVEEESQGNVPLGASVRAWMQRQRDGVQQSRNPQGLTPPEEHRSRTRYLDSYTHPIPPLFEIDKLSSD